MLEREEWDRSSSFWLVPEPAWGAISWEVEFCREVKLGEEGPLRLATPLEDEGECFCS